MWLPGRKPSLVDPWWLNRESAPPSTGSSAPSVDAPSVWSGGSVLGEAGPPSQVEEVIPVRHMYHIVTLVLGKYPRAQARF